MSEFAHAVMMLLAEKAQFILCFFAVVTVLAWLKAGRDALVWNDSLRCSGAVNLAIVAFNMVALVIPLAATAFLLDLLKDLPHVPAQVWPVGKSRPHPGMGPACSHRRDSCLFLWLVDQ